MQRVLSERPGLGRVVMCGACDDVHVSVGRASFRVPHEMFRALSLMMSEATAHPALFKGEKFSVRFEDGVPCFAPIGQSEGPSA